MDAREENATVQYMKWTDLYLKEKPFQMFLDLPPDAADQRKTNVVFEPKEIVVQNIRGREADLDLDHQGFIVRRLTEIPDLKDLDTTIVESVYLPAMEKLLRAEVEGVDRVFFFDWRVGRYRESCLASELAKLTGSAPKFLRSHCRRDRQSQRSLRKTGTGKHCARWYMITIEKIDAEVY